MLQAFVRFFKLSLPVAILLLSLNVKAFLPESGWWWNQSESGRGFNIEIQDNQLFLATFVYDANGNAVWYTAGGKMASDRSFSGPLTAYRGGQCVGCTYKAPQDGGSPGNISLTFDTPNSATVVWPGGTTRISRFTFGVNWTAPSAIMGEWAFVIGSPTYPLYFGERVKFNSTYVSGATTYAAGNRTGESGANGLILAGLFDKSSSQWSAIMDSSDTYYDYYVISWEGVNTIRGKAWTYKKTEKLSGAGLDFVGFRMSGLTAASGGGGPSILSQELRARPLTSRTIAGLPGSPDSERLANSFAIASAVVSEAGGEAEPEDIEEIRADALRLQKAFEASRKVTE